MQKEILTRMKRLLALVAVLLSGLVLNATAQTSAAAPAGPTKVAIVTFQAAVGQTNEFQRDFADLQKKFEPQRTQLKTLSDEIDSLTKALQANAEKLSDSDRASRAKTIEDKKKQAQRLGQEAQSDFQQAMQELYGGVATKVEEVLASYAEQQGYTVVIDATQQQQASPIVLYANPATDITKAVLDAYNVKSGVPAPPAQPAGAATRPAAKAPAAK
jgi:outer membrane protein